VVLNRRSKFVPFVWSPGRSRSQPAIVRACGHTTTARRAPDGRGTTADSCARGGAASRCSTRGRRPRPRSGLPARRPDPGRSPARIAVWRSTPRACGVTSAWPPSPRL
jgi:hypothetical protein